MAYLIDILALPLLAMALLGAYVGWCWNCVRTSDRMFVLKAEREKLRRDLHALAGGDPRRLMDLEEEAAAQKAKAEAAAARAALAEKELPELRGRAAEVEMLRAKVRELEAAPAAPSGIAGLDLQARIQDLEAELKSLEQKAADAEALRLQAADLEARLKVSAGPADEGDAAASKWRLRYLESRVRYLEGRLAEAEKAQSAIDPEAYKALQGELAAARRTAAELQTLPARLAALEADLVAARAKEAETKQILWRARYLEARVKHLEGQVTPLQAVAAADKELISRAGWRARYFEARAAFLEGQERETLKGLEVGIAQERERRQKLEEELQALRNAQTDSDFLREMIATLEADLKAAKAEADALEGERARADGLAKELAALRAAPAPTVDEGELTRARWKARYLESRVRYLEDRLAAAPRPAPQPLIAPRALEAVLPPPAPPVPPPAPPPAPPPQTRLRERLVWRQVRVVEEAPIEPPPPPPPPPPVREPRYVWRQVRVLEDAPAPPPAPPPPPPPPPRERIVWERVLVTEDEPTGERAYAVEPRSAFYADPPRPTLVEERRPRGITSPRGGAPDDLRMITGVGPKIEATLHDLGIFHFDQIAAWTREEIAWVDRFLAFRGRIDRENWVDQAARLARGEETEGKRRYLAGDEV